MTSDQVRSFEPLVKACVRKIASRSLPASIDRDDLEQTAWQALLLARGSYNPAKNDSLDAWLWLRMRGAMLNEIDAHRFGKRGSEWSEPGVINEEIIGAFESIHERVEARMALRDWVESSRPLCECGCGEQTRLSRKPLRFVNGHNLHPRSPVLGFRSGLRISDEVAA